MRNRLSFVELAFREREAQIAEVNATLPKTLCVFQPIVDGISG
jgi:hypothetical protein